PRRAARPRRPLPAPARAPDGALGGDGRPGRPPGMTDAAAAASVRVRGLDRALLPLLIALLVALMTSITVVGVVTGLLIVVSLLRLADPASRARDRAPLGWPLLAFAAATLLSAACSGHAGAALFESKQLLGIAIFLSAVNGF